MGILEIAAALFGGLSLVAIILSRLNRRSSKSPANRSPSSNENGSASKTPSHTSGSDTDKKRQDILGESITSATETGKSLPDSFTEYSEDPLRSQSAEKTKPEVQREFVECSAFSRDSVEAEKEFLVQAAVHKPSEFESVAREAKSADPGTARRKSRQFKFEIGQRITLSLEARGVEIEDPVREIEWNGRTVFEEYDIVAPAAGFERVTLKLKIYIDGNPAGRCIWSITERAHAISGETISSRFEPYRRAFLSYSSEDRIEVLKFSQALNVLNIEFFQDLLSLNPGERYAEVIEQELEVCDLFVLFWSSHSVKSEWVKKEAILALEHQNKSENSRPDFAVLTLETPPPENPHPELKSAIHLNDMIRYVIDRETSIKNTSIH